MNKKQLLKYIDKRIESLAEDHAKASDSYQNVIYGQIMELNNLKLVFELERKR